MSAQYSIKVIDQAAPTELAEPIRAVLGDKCVQLLDGKSEVLVEVWFRNGVPAKATDAKGSNAR